MELFVDPFQDSHILLVADKFLIIFRYTGLLSNEEKFLFLSYRLLLLLYFKFACRLIFSKNLKNDEH